MKRLLKSAIIPPRVMITDKLPLLHGAARGKDGAEVEHRRRKPERSRGNSHQPPGGATDNEAIQISSDGEPVLNDYDQVETSSTSLLPKSSL